MTMKIWNAPMPSRRRWLRFFLSAGSLIILYLNLHSAICNCGEVALYPPLRSGKNIWLIHRIISFLSSFKHTRFSASLRCSWSIWYLMTILIARSWKWLGTCQFPVCVPSGIPYVVMRISWQSALRKRFSARTLERHFRKRLSGIIAAWTRTGEAIFIKNANDLRYVTW